MFEKYDHHLSYSCKHNDFWSDVGISEAINILEEFSDDDWKALFEAIKVRAPIWLKSCAETLGEMSDSSRAHELLLLLFQNNDPEVAWTAKESIRAYI